MKKDDHKYEFGVFILRAQPPHLGHISIINQVLSECRRAIVLLGSADEPRTPKNPFTEGERISMIRGALTEEQNAHLSWQPLYDNTYHDEAWVEHVQKQVKAITMDYGSGDRSSVALYGHNKDKTSWYLKAFPQWERVEVPGYHSDHLSSTRIRSLYFKGEMSYVKGAVPESTYQFLRGFKETDEYQVLKDEYSYYRNYDPRTFPVNMVTVDAVVVQSGHVLLVKRKYSPGKDLWALPGGFVGTNETIREALIRELHEETNLRVPPKVLNGSLKTTTRESDGYIAYSDCRVFDKPDRSQRGRIITHAFYVRLDDSLDLPRVSGGDDAAEARWFPLVEFRNMRSKMYEDHYHVVTSFL